MFTLESMGILRLCGMLKEKLCCENFHTMSSLVVKFEIFFFFILKFSRKFLYVIIVFSFNLFVLN